MAGRGGGAEAEVRSLSSPLLMVLDLAIGGVPYGGDRRLVASRTRGGPLVPGGLRGGRHGPPGLAVALIWTCLIECDGGPSPQLPATSPCPVPAS